MDPSNVFVCIMGMSIVFIGLIIIVILCKIMNYLCQISEQSKLTATVPNNNSISSIPVEEAVIPNRQELIAAISAAIAEELGEDISAIRILSLKKI